MTSREYLAEQHLIAKEPIKLPAGYSTDEPERYAVAGNWFNAADAYSRLENELIGSIDQADRARLLARSATCFDIAGRHLSAARVYSDAANVLVDEPGAEQSAGELYNRSAHCYRLAGDHFSAGTTWMSSARMFEKLGKSIIQSNDNILPVPMSAAALTVAGSCLDAAGEAFLRTSGTSRNWATMAFWLAGDAYSRTFPSPNIQAAWSYKAALANGIRQYGSVVPPQSQEYLPLSADDRAAGVDGVSTMEMAYYNSNHAQLLLNGREDAAEKARQQTDEEMASIFQEFAMLLESLGNAYEASHFRNESNQRIEIVNWRRRHFGKWSLHFAWRLTSKYGESPYRWLLCTASVILVFSVFYQISGSAEPATSFLDYLYFSVVTFTSLGYGDIQPIGFLGRTLAALEVSVGLILFGVLLTFFSNRVAKS